MPKDSPRKRRQRKAAKTHRQERERDPELQDMVADALADIAGRESIDVLLWRIAVPLPPPPKDVQARRLLESVPLTPQERIEQERRARLRDEQPKRGTSADGWRPVPGSWVADPSAAEGEVTIEVRVTSERVELDEPDPPIETLNRRAWNRIQERYGKPVGLRLDQGRPVVMFADGVAISGQGAERYGTRSAVSPADLIDRLARCTYLPRLTDDELARLGAHLKAPVSLSRLQRDPAERARRAKLKEILTHNDELRRTNAAAAARRAGDEDRGDKGGRAPATPTEPIDPSPKPGDARNNKGTGGFTVAALREMTGLENTALNRYAKAANVKTPRRGERNFRYPTADVRAILETIIAKTGEDTLRVKCQTALQDLQEIAE